MEELQTLNPDPETASNAQVMLMVLNTTGVQLVPATVIGILSAAGAVQPTAIISTTLVATFVGTVVAAVSALLLQRFFPAPVRVVDADADRVAIGDHEIEAGVPESRR